jgi:Zn-dependent metalloprotease
MYDRNPVQCIIPPYINDRLTQSPNPTVRAHAVASIRAAATLRAQRVMSQAMPGLMASAAPTKKRQRLVYDAKKSDHLPGKLVRSEGQGKVADATVNRAYDYSGDTYDFFDQLFGRKSLDNNGMRLISSVHVGEVDDTGKLVPMTNAVWNGEQMAYGDGDGVIFRDFTASRDVVSHELTHGVELFTSNLDYRNQSGALNEHFADVFGILVRQWVNGETALRANWLIGTEVLMPAPTRRAIRDMEHPGTAFAGDPDLGDDPQPAHMKDLYTGPADRGGVHLNSGIPNRAFVLVAKALKGNAWDVAGRIWYDTMLQLTSTSQIVDCAKLTLQVAGTKYGVASRKAVNSAWKKVGISL